MSIGGSDWVKSTGSTAYFSATEWAGRLLARAVQEPPEHDLDALLRLFADHSEYYRDRIRDAGSWSRLAPLDKADIADIPVRSATPVGANRTSGTSGFQVTIRNNAWEREFRRALLYRPQLFYELPRDVVQVVFVDGASCATPTSEPKYFEYGDQRYRTWFVGAGAEPGDVLHLLATLRPQLIRGISSGIVRFIESAGEMLTHLGARYVAPGGEYLRPEWRALMEDAFAAIVLDRYGSTESGALAWQCPRCRRYHANVDEIVIEAEAEGIVTTPLFVSSQPLLRYRLGDRVRFDEYDADCDVRLPTIIVEAARRDDWIIDGAGRKVSPLSFRFEQVPHLDAWRLHQQADGALRLYYESAQPAEVEPRLARELAEAVPDRPFSLDAGIWNLQRPGKFKRVSSDIVAGRVSSEPAS